MSVIPWLWLYVCIKLVKMSRFAQLVLQTINSTHLKSNIYDNVSHRAPWCYPKVPVTVLSLHDIMTLKVQAAPALPSEHKGCSSCLRCDELTHLKEGAELSLFAGRKASNFFVVVVINRKHGVQSARLAAVCLLEDHLSNPAACREALFMFTL